MNHTHAQLRNDDPTRLLTLTDPDDPTLLHLAIGESTYTILISGTQTAGRYSLIDMSVPIAGGPPPHRHTFEEMFHVLEGELEVSIRGEIVVARPGQTVNIPALAPHAFTNTADTMTRLLCIVAPAGLEDYFAAFGDPVATRTSPPPTLSDAELATPPGARRRARRPIRYRAGLTATRARTTSGAGVPADLHNASLGAESAGLAAPCTICVHSASRLAATAPNVEICTYFASDRLPGEPHRPPGPHSG